MGAHLLRLVLVVALGLTGCAGSGQASEDGEPDARLDCRELGFPCSWADAAEGTFEESARLLIGAGNDLDEGVDPETVAMRLAEDPAVVSAVAGPTGVQFRVEGAPVVVAYAPTASPIFNAVENLASTGDLPLLSAAALEAPAERGRPMVTAATYRTTREAGLRPRSALLIRPWKQFDLETIHRKRVARGLAQPDEEPDWDELLSWFDGTAEVFRSSEHFTLRQSDTVAAFGTFAAHDVVIIETHTSTFGADKGCDPAQGHVCGPVLGGPVLGSSTVDPDAIDADAVAAVNELRESVQFRQQSHLPIGATIGKIFDHWTIAFTPDYFRHQYGSGPSLDTVLFINSCGTGHSELMTAILGSVTGSEGGTVFAWTNAIDAIEADATTALIADLLANEAVSTEQAMDALEPSDLRHTLGGTSTSTQLIRQGGDLRARDAVTVQDRGARMEPRAMIEVDGDPEDGIDDVITSLSIRVDGVLADREGDAVLRWQLRNRHPDPLEVRAPFTSADGRTVQDVTDPDDGDWRDYLVTFTNLDLEFDLERDDLTFQREHTLTVEIDEGDGAVSRHQIVPVFLRKEVVAVLDPELGLPLESGDRVLVRGRAGDGAPEVYELVVGVENVDRAAVGDLVLEVNVGDQRFTESGSAWEEIDEGTYRFTRDVVLDDFPDQEKEVVVDARIQLPERGEITHVVDPLVLVVERGGPCDLLRSDEVTDALGRPFGDPVEFQSVCMWRAERSEFQLSVFEGTAALVETMAAEDRVDGIGDAAAYATDLADPPSGIRIDGVMQYSNFVNLSVAIGDDLVVLHPQGNIVVEDGPERLLVGLADLVRILETRM